VAGSGFKKQSAVADRTVLTSDLRLIPLYELNVRTESTLDYEGASQLGRGRIQVITVHRLTSQKLILVAVILYFIYFLFFYFFILFYLFFCGKGRECVMHHRA